MNLTLQQPSQTLSQHKILFICIVYNIFILSYSIFNTKALLEKDMAIIFVIVVVAVIVIGLAIVIGKSLAAPKKIDSVKKLLKQGKNQAAAKLAKQIIAKDAKDYHAHYYLGKAYFLDGRKELALIEYAMVNENAIFDNTLPEISFRQEYASLLTSFDRNEEAMKEYLLLTKQDPTNANNFFKAGKLSEQLGRKDLALGFYKKCVSIDKKNAKAHAAIGYILFQTKQLADAKKELDYAISLDPSEYSCYYYLGKLLKDAKDIAGAVKAFDKAQRDNEFKQKALVERATCYIMANRLDNAEIDLQRAIELDKDGTKNDTLYARYFLASCFEKTRKIDKAIEQWEIIYSKNHAFRDVNAKLSEYKDLQTNDNLKDYLTCSDTEFIETCKSICQAMKFSSQQATLMKDGCVLFAVDAKDADWRNVRKQTNYIRFFRTPDPIEEQSVRETLDKAKSSNCVKSYIVTSSEFTKSAVSFAENRPVELIEKKKLESLLAKAMTK